MSRKDLLSKDTDRRDQNPYYSALPAVVSTIQMEFTFGLWASEQNGMEDGASEEYQWFYVTSLLGNVVCIDVQTLVPSFIILTSWSLMRQKLLLLCRHLPFNMRFTNEGPRWKDWKDLITYISYHTFNKIRGVLARDFLHHWFFKSDNI